MCSATILPLPFLLRVKPRVLPTPLLEVGKDGLDPVSGEPAPDLGVVEEGAAGGLGQVEGVDAVGLAVVEDEAAPGLDLLGPRGAVGLEAGAKRGWMKDVRRGEGMNVKKGGKSYCQGQGVPPGCAACPPCPPTTASLPALRSRRRISQSQLPPLACKRSGWDPQVPLARFVKGSS